MVPFCCLSSNSRWKGAILGDSQMSGFSSNVVGNHHFQSDQFQSTLFIRLQPIAAQNRRQTVYILLLSLSLSVSIDLQPSLAHLPKSSFCEYNWREKRQRLIIILKQLSPPPTPLCLSGWLAVALFTLRLNVLDSLQTNNVWNRNPFNLETAACTCRP